MDTANNKRVRFYFHGQLNDFLHHTKRSTWFAYPFKGAPSIKDAIEAIGIPHPEIGILLQNTKPAELNSPMEHLAQMEVFPIHFTDAEAARLAGRPEQFILDVHLGKLARGLRMLGFDSLYENDYEDQAIASIAAQENRIVLTRDIGLLKHKAVQWGYWLRSQQTEEQVQEVLAHFKLEPPFHPFTRCMACNGSIVEAPKEKVQDQLPPNTRKFFQEYFQCQSCQRVYWKGSHFEKMREKLNELGPSS